VARLPYLEPEQSSDPELVARLYARVAGWGRPVGHLYTVLANQPAALEAFLGMSRYVRDCSSLDDELRELAVLATAHALDQPYERAHHEPIAIAVGIPPDTVAAIASGRTNGLEPLQRAIVSYADQVARRGDVDDDVFEALRDGLDAAQLTDLVVTVAWYHLCAAILSPLRVEVEREDTGS
jgi:4-carboxymuconolactone decarboxylase